MKPIDDVQANMGNVFNLAGYEPGTVAVTPTTYKDKPALRIETSKMYGFVEPKAESLLGLCKAFEEATGCANLDIVEEYHRDGCKTCDYGSSYNKVYVVWD